METLMNMHKRNKKICQLVTWWPLMETLVTIINLFIDLSIHWTMLTTALTKKSYWENIEKLTWSTKNKNRGRVRVWIQILFFIFIFFSLYIPLQIFFYLVFRFFILSFTTYYWRTNHFSSISVTDSMRYYLL